MSERYAFFLDIDSTLLSRNGVGEENKSMIKYARENGHLVFLNTGRSLGDIPRCVKEIEFDGIISEMGCNILYKGEKILCVDIDHKEIAELFDYFTNTNREFVIQNEINDLSNVPYEYSIFVRNSDELIDKYSEYKMSKVFIPHVLSDDEQKCLSEKYNFVQHKSYAEFCKKGYSKKTGIQKIIELTGIKKEQCVAMGDSANDLEMLKYAGISVAMGDADENIKDICTFVSKPSYENGVAYAMKKILKK